MLNEGSETLFRLLAKLCRLSRTCADASYLAFCFSEKPTAAAGTSTTAISTNHLRLRKTRRYAARDELSVPACESIERLQVRRCGRRDAQPNRTLAGLQAHAYAGFKRGHLPSPFPS